jgi:hypothetical protein
MKKAAAQDGEVVLREPHCRVLLHVRPFLGVGFCHHRLRFLKTSRDSEEAVHAVAPIVG